MNSEQRFQKVFFKEKWRNTFIIKDYFPLEVVEEITPIDSHCKTNYGDYLKNKKNLRYFATMSKDSRFVAVIVKYDGSKHRRLLEAIGIEEFTVHYKIINN